MFFRKKPTPSEEEETKPETEENNVQTQEEEEVPILDLPPEVVRYNPTCKTGLTEEQVNERVASLLTNQDPDTTGKTISAIIRDNTLTLFNVILFFIAGVLIFFKLYAQISFMVIVVVNTLIGIVQEVKAKKTLDKLKLVTASEVKVIRNGFELTIPTSDLVLDDVYRLNSGEQITCDSTVMDGVIEVNESLLTGESLPIKKEKGEKIFAGSFVVSGSALVKAEKVGKYNYVANIQAKAKALHKPKSELLKTMNLIIKVVSIVVIPLGILTFLTQLYSNFANVQAITYDIAQKTVARTAASMVGMIPSGMYLLTSVALASSILNLSKKNAMVQDLYSVEMLARVDTLCLDKTGTLTDGTMRVDEVMMIDGQYNMDDLMGNYLAAFTDSNQTSIALSHKYTLKKTMLVKNSIPFSSARKYSAVEFDGLGTFALGAPEYLYKGKDKSIASYIQTKQTAGYRVVMLCVNPTQIEKGELKGKNAPVAIFTLEDHIRPEAPDTIKWFTDNGVEIKIISGDNPVTVKEIAAKCNVPNADKAISLEGLSDNEVIAQVNEFSVFGRVSPEQKALIIKTLKSANKTVGMTGDGVNDILAMKNSDCSVAMANGSSAARNAAHIVLLDSNFASMPAAVQEGRRAINNVQRSSSLYLMKTIFTVVFTIIVLLTFVTGKAIDYPFETNNLLIMEMICIGFVSLFLSIQKTNEQKVHGNFLGNTLLCALPAAIMMIICVGLNYLLVYTSDFYVLHAPLASDQELMFTTLNTLTMVVISLAMDFCCCSPMAPISDKYNRFRAIMMTITLVLLFLFVFVASWIPAGDTSNVCKAFVGIDYHSLDQTMWLMLAIYGLASFIIINYIYKAFINAIPSDKQIAEKRKEKEAKIRALKENAEPTPTEKTEK